MNLPIFRLHCEEIILPIFTSSESENEVSSSVSGQFNQKELNDLIRDLNMSKESSEILASRLNENKPLPRNKDNTLANKKGMFSAKILEDFS